MNKMVKKILHGFTALAVSAMLLLPAVPVYAVSLTRDAADVKYQITFLAGSQGAIEGAGESLVCEVNPGDQHPDLPDVEPNSTRNGAKKDYVFVGWDQAYPGHIAVDGSATYVAQYAVLVDGVEYAVQYVDQDGIELLSPKYRNGSNGQVVSETSKTVEGYTVADDQLTMTLAKGRENVMQFVYTSDAGGEQPPVGPEPEAGVTENVTTETVVVPGPAGPDTVIPAPTTPDPVVPEAEVPTEEITDPENPLANPEDAPGETDNPTEEIVGEENPLANAEKQAKTSAALLWTVGGVGVLVLGGGTLLFVLKRKKNNAKK